jgi:hypothetical protein
MQNLIARVLAERLRRVTQPLQELDDDRLGARENATAALRQMRARD